MQIPLYMLSFYRAQACGLIVMEAEMHAFQPVRPSEFLKENENAIDWGSCGIAAFATGSTINFFVCGNKNIVPLYCSDFRGGKITSIRFHSVVRWAAFGDNRSNVVIWNVERRGVVASYLPNVSGVRVLDIQWRGDIVVVLLSSRKLLALQRTKNANDPLRPFHLSPLWEMNLKEDYSRISFDPHANGMMLSGEKPQFSVYKARNIEERPRSFFECVELSRPDDIQDAQWSEHFERFIWVVLCYEIVFFHIESQTIIPIIKQRKTQSAFWKIIQSADHHDRIMVLHRNGAITCFKADENMCFSVECEIQPRHSASTIVKMSRNAMTDRELFVVFSGLGPAIFNIPTKTIVKSCFTFPVAITCVDSDAEHLVYGTQRGNVIIVTQTGTYRYFVCDSGVVFVGLAASANKVYWQGRSSIGEIDLEKRKVIEYTSRASAAFRCISTPFGGFMVQREPHVLGVFVNGQEKPVLLPSEAIDACLDMESSSPTKGSFAVIQKNNEMLFYEYSESTGVGYASFRFTLRAAVGPMAFVRHGNLLVICFENGSIVFHDFATKKTSTKYTSARNFRKLRICDGVVYGLCNDSNVFYYSKSIKICPYSVKDYSIVKAGQVFIIGDDNIARIVETEKWSIIAYEPETSLSRNDTIIRHIENHPLAAFNNPSESQQTMVQSLSQGELLSFSESPRGTIDLEDLEKKSEYLWFRPDSRLFWICFRSNPPLCMRCHYAVGDSQLYNELIAKLNFYVQYITRGFQRIKYRGELFANKFGDAARTLMSEVQGESDIERNGAIAGCILACEDQVSEKMASHCRSVAMSLFQKGQFLEGATFLRIARLDKVAVEYLLKHNQLTLALKFIRGLSGKDKDDMLTLLAVKHYKKRHHLEAAFFFCSAKQYHAMLHVMNVMGMNADAFFLKKYLLLEGLLTPAEPEVQKLMPDIQEFVTLSANIDSSFAEIATEVGVNPKTIKSLVA